MFYGDLQVPKGDGHHLPGVDKQPLTIGVLDPEGDGGWSAVTQIPSALPASGDLRAVGQVEHRSGAIFTEGEGSFGIVSKREAQFQRREAQFNRVQSQAIQNQFSVQSEQQAGGIIQGKYEGKGLVRQYPVNGIGHLHLQIGEILRCKGAVSERPQRNPCAILFQIGSMTATLISRSSAGIHQGTKRRPPAHCFAGISDSGQADLHGQNEREGETLFNTLRTSKGGEYTVELSDGTVVYLNAVSELRYPVEFGDDERVVCFSGEGYFDVAKDAKRPFRVVVGGMSVVVRGTEFNVNTFKEAGVQTVLVEGAVGVRVNGKEEVRLKPSQLAEYNAESGLVSVREVDAHEYVAWKDGFFVFDDESLEEIMGTLSRWYDVEVFYVNEGAKELHFTGHLKRYDDIDVILRAIESAVDVTFSVNGRMVSVAR